MVSKAIAKRPAAPVKKKPRGAALEQAEIVLTGLPTIELVTQALEEHSKFFVEESEEGAGESMLLSKLRNAKNVDDLAKESDLLSVTDVLGTNLLIQTIDAVRNSDFAESTFGVYLVVTATTDQGELVKLGVGSAEPFAFIVAWHEWGELPRWIRFERAEKATKGGFYPVNVTDGGPYHEGKRPF